LHAAAHGFDFRHVDRVQRRERGDERGIVLDEIAVVVDRVDEGDADRAVAIGHRGEVELPEQVVAQIFRRSILRRAFVVGAAARAAVVTVF
jgi:hypothetical protein